MPSRRNTSAAGQPATPTDTSMRQTRARSKLNNAPRLMSGLDHRGRAVDPLSTDPESIIFDDVVKQLRTRRKKKIIFRHRDTTPESPTLDVKAAKRAQLKRKAPDLSPASASSSFSRSQSPSPSPLRPALDGDAPFVPRSLSSSPLRQEHDSGKLLDPRSSSSSSSDPDEDGGVPLHPQSSSPSSSSTNSDGRVLLNPQPSSSSSSSSSDLDSDGGVRLNSTNESSSSASESDFKSDCATYGSSVSPLCRGSPWASDSSHTSGSSRSRDSSNRSGGGASEPLGDNNPGWASQPRPSPPTLAVPPNTPEVRGSPHAPAPDADDDAPMESGIKTIKRLPPSPGDAVHGFESRLVSRSTVSRTRPSRTRQLRPEDITIPKQVDEEVDDDEDESPRTSTRRIRSGCAGRSLRKRRRSKDDGSAPQAIKKPRVDMELTFTRTFSIPYDYESDNESDIAPQAFSRIEEEEEEEDVFYSPPEDPIPVTEQTDINPIPSPTLTATRIPGLAFLETQTVSINTDNESPKVLTPVEPAADFDSEIPGMYGSGKRPRLDYDWYEQYHRFGPDCQKVHGCQHGLFCHQCHADWHKAWSHFFKKKDEVDSAVANYDIRKGYLGTALGFEHSPMPVIQPIPPRGGKIRTHPARIAKEKLALMERMAKEGCEED